MSYISIDPLLTATDLAEAWNKVSQEAKDILAINMSDSYSISGQEQFETFWLNVPLVYTLKNKVHAERMFLMIFHEQTLLLQKIKNQKAFIEALGDMDIWADETALEYTNKVQGHTENINKIKSDSHGEQSLRGESNNDSSNVTKSTTLNKSGSSDNNSQTLDSGIFIVEDDISTSMPIAAMSQARAIIDNATKLTVNAVNNSKNESLNQLNSVTNNAGKSDHLYEYKSKTSVGNPSNDYIDYLKLNVDIDFRKQFYAAFRDIFATQ